MPILLETTDLVTEFHTYEGVVKALDKVSLRIDQGATFGLVGESGCGKSVTVRSMMRLVQEPGRIESGRILFFPDQEAEREGLDLLALSEAEMRAIRGDSISMIFQEPNAALNPTMSVRDQVGESFLFHQKEEMCAKILEDLKQTRGGPLTALQKALYGLAAEKPDSAWLKLFDRTPLLRLWQRRLRKEARARSLAIIAKLGIPNPERIVDSYPHNLSGGMKQRIVIAMALACSPILLIADEATSNLDVTIQAQILELLKKLKEEIISSILLITHDLGVVAETCDRVGVMYAGQVCEVADVEDLFQNPLHPYTRALLESVPKLTQTGELRPIRGNVPNLVAPPPGCRFHPRCALAREICSREKPEMEERGPGHLAACHALDQGADAPGGKNGAGV